MSPDLRKRIGIGLLVFFIGVPVTNFLLTIIVSVDSYKYPFYVARAALTKDEITYQRTCGEYSLTVTHTDVVEMGTPLTIDTSGRPPALVDVYVFSAATGAEELLGFTNRSHQIVKTDLPTAAQAAYVIDRKEFELMVAHPAYYRDARAVYVKPDSSLTEEKIEEIARCYAEDRAEINSALRTPVSSFVTPKKEVGGKFQCPSGDFVSLGFRLLYLNNETDNAIGKLGIDGELYPAKQDDESVQNNKVPLSKRALKDWAACTNEKGMSLDDFVRSETAKIIYVDSVPAPRPKKEESPTPQQTLSIQEFQLTFSAPQSWVCTKNKPPSNYPDWVYFQCHSSSRVTGEPTMTIENVKRGLASPFTIDEMVDFTIDGLQFTRMVHSSTGTNSGGVHNYRYDEKWGGWLWMTIPYGPGKTYATAAEARSAAEKILATFDFE